MAQDLPEYKRTTAISPSGNVPDFGTAANNFGAASNWMSDVGAKIAQTASDKMMEQMGTEAGKNPTENRYLFTGTNADKKFAQAYTAQAHSTLGLQANKLIADSNMELASAYRLTPELIDKSQKQISLGLQNIFKNAPASIRPEMEYQYGTQQINQEMQLSERMVREGREDSKNITLAAGHENTQQAFELASSGNFKAADVAVQQVRDSYTAQEANKNISPAVRDAAIESAVQARINGAVIYGAKEAEKQGKQAEYWDDFAKNKKGLTEKQWVAAGQAGLAEMQFIAQMKNQKQQLVMAKFDTQLAMNPNITPTELREVQSQLNPLQAEQVEFKYIQKLKAYNKTTEDEAGAQAVWGDSGALSQFEDKVIGKTWNALSNKLVSDSQKTANPISRDEAEVMVANSAGVPVRLFTKTLNNGLTSGNPDEILRRSGQIQLLRDMEGGHALQGLSPTADAIAIQFNHQRGTKPDTELAREITDNLTNLGKDTIATLDNEWNFLLTQSQAGGAGAIQSHADFALKASGLTHTGMFNAEPDFGGGYFKTIYGNDIYGLLKSNFITARGDYQAAVEMTQNYVKENYGETRVNGGIITTDRPIEKYLGYSDTGVTPFIQQDVGRSLTERFQAPIKEVEAKLNNPDLLPEQKISLQNQMKHLKNDTWEFKPVNTEKKPMGRTTIRDVYPKMEVIRTVQTDKGPKKFSYPVSLVGRPGNQWDIVVTTPGGKHNLFLVAPQFGVATYTPDAESIRKNYLGSQKGWF